MGDCAFTVTAKNPVSGSDGIFFYTPAGNLASGGGLSFSGTVLTGNTWKCNTEYTAPFGGYQSCPPYPYAIVTIDCTAGTGSITYGTNAPVFVPPSDGDVLATNDGSAPQGILIFMPTGGGASGIDYHAVIPPGGTVNIPYHGASGVPTVYSVDGDASLPLTDDTAISPDDNSSVNPSGSGSYVFPGGGVASGGTVNGSSNSVTSLNILNQNANAAANSNQIASGVSQIVSALGTGTPNSSGTNGVNGTTWTNGITDSEFKTDSAYYQTNLLGNTNQGAAFDNAAVTGVEQLAGVALSAGMSSLSNSVAGINPNEDLGTINGFNDGFETNVAGFMTISFPNFTGNVITGTTVYDMNMRHTTWYAELTFIERSLYILCFTWSFLWLVYDDTEKMFSDWMKIPQSRGNTDVMFSPLGVGVRSSAPSALLNAGIIAVLVLGAPLLVAGFISTVDVVSGGSAVLNVTHTPAHVIYDSVVNNVVAEHQPYLSWGLLVLGDFIPLAFTFTFVVEYAIWKLARSYAFYLISLAIKAVNF